MALLLYKQNIHDFDFVDSFRAEREGCRSEEAHPAQFFSFRNEQQWNGRDRFLQEPPGREGAHFCWSIFSLFASPSSCTKAASPTLLFIRSRSLSLSLWLFSLLLSPVFSLPLGLLAFSMFKPHHSPQPPPLNFSFLCPPSFYPPSLLFVFFLPFHPTPPLSFLACLPASLPASLRSLSSVRPSFHPSWFLTASTTPYPHLISQQGCHAWTAKNARGSTSMKSYSSNPPPPRCPSMG